VGRIASDANVRRKDGNPPVAPTSLRVRYGPHIGVEGVIEGYVEDYAMPIEISDPRSLVAEYVNAAKLAKEAGFDGVELHGANGYLIAEVRFEIITFC
jgi:2,4-dienoyl-CoA reductase-like NADH-dependent reductase (Old Yellow Enzyme family)